MGKIDHYEQISKVYKQTETKKLLLIPGVLRALRKYSSKGGNLLDVGCGTGDFYEDVEKFGYKYFGFDASKSMLSRARANHPLGKFELLSATNFADKYKIKFSVILLNLVLQDNPLKDEKKIITEVSKSLNKSGIAVVGIHHPHFDHYMRFGLLGQTKRKTGAIKANFKNYFKSGDDYLLKYFYDEGQAEFKDYHVTLEDYFEMFVKSGFEVLFVDECSPGKKLEKMSKSKFEEKTLYPTYLVFTLKKK